MSVHFHREIRGFTLLEVMIALAILSVCSAGLITAVSQTIRQGARLEEKTLATWVANNHIAEMRATRAYPRIGRDTASASMSGRDWLLDIQTFRTPTRDLRRVEVGVSPKLDGFQNEASPTVIITTYLGKPE